MKIIKSFIICCIFGSSLLLAGNSAIELQINETGVYKYPQARAIIVQDNQVIYYENLEYNVVKIIGRKIGTAYLNLLDYDNNLTTIKIEIKNKKQAVLSNIVKRKYHGNNVLYVKSDPQNKTFVNQKVLVNKLTLTTKSNDTSILTKVNYKSYAVSNNDDDKALESLVLQIDSARNRTIFGDNQINYSEISIPYLNLQGIRTMGLLRLNKLPFSYDLFAGKSVGRYWGKLLEYKANFEDTTLTGANFTAIFDDNLSLSYLMAQKVQTQNDTAKVVAKTSAIKAKYSLDKKVLVLGELAYDLDSNYASVSDLRFYDGNFDLNLKFTNIEADYTAVSDWTHSQQGKRGVALYSGWRQDLFAVRAYWDRFSRLYPQSVLNENTFFENKKLFINFFNVAFTKPMIYLYDSDSSDVKRGGWTLYLNDIDLKYLTFYFKYNPNYYFKQSDGTKNNIDTVTYGLNKNLGLINLTLEKLVSNYNQHNIYKSYVFNATTVWRSITWLKSNGRFSYRYQTRSDAHQTIDDNISVYRAEFRNSITPDLSWNLSFKYTYSHSLRYIWQEQAYLFPEQDITQGSVEGSLSLVF